MAIDPEAYKNKTHTGRFIGAKGNEGMAVYNPETGGYERYTIEDWNKRSSAGRKESGNNIAHHYTNRFGENVYGYRPENTHTGMLSGESFVTAGKDPYADKYIRNDNGTPVPGAGMLNPDFVEPESRFQTRSGDAKISYAPPTDAQAAWENKIANFNPDERAAWESNVEGMLANTLNNSQPVTPGQDVVPLTPGQQAAWNTPEAGAALEAKWDGTVDGLNVATAVIQNTQNSDDIPVFIEQAYSLMSSDPEAFDAWAKDNPLWAGRFYAYLADATQERQSQIDGHHPLYNTHTTGLPFSLATLLGDQVTPREELEHEYVPEGSGFDEDYYRTKANELLGYGHDFSGREFKDINNRNGADFFKLGGNNTSRHGSVLDYLKKNPLEVGAMVALATLAPHVAANMGLAGVPAGMASGALTSFGNGIITGNTDDLLMSTFKGGVTGGLGTWAGGAEGILVKNYGWNASVANIVTTAVGDAVINGTDPVQAFITAASAEGINVALDAAKDVVGDMFSTDELEVKIGDDGTSTATINQDTLDELDFLSENPDGLQEIDLGTIPSPRPPSSPSIPGPRDDGMLTGGSEGPAADIGDDGLDWDNIESAGTGPSQESIAANNKAAVEAAERMANLNPGDEGFREAWDELARVHTGDLLTAGGNAPAGAVEYHTKATIEKAYDAVFGHGAYQTKLGQSDDAFDAMVEELTTPKLSGTVELNRDQIPDPIYNPRDPQTPDGPLFEPDMPDLNMGFDEQDIILDSMDNTFTPDRFEPQWKLPEEEVKKVTQDILGGGGNLASSTSDALEGAIGDAPEIVQEAAESILGDIGDNIGDVDLSALGDMSLPSREQVVEGVRVALGTVGASLDDISTEVTLGNGDVVEVSLEDSILGNDPQGPAGGNEGSPGGTPGAPDGTVGAPSGTPGQPPTPNSNLPEGIAWEPNGTGGWNIRNSNTGEVFTQKEFADAIYGSLVNGTGTTGTGGTGGTGTTGAGSGTSGSGSGSHPGVVGGIHAGTGQSVIGNSGTGGTGGGTGGGNGAGDGPGDGFGGGSDTPLADGLMRSLGQGTNIPTGLVDIPQVAPIQTRPLDWSFLRKVSEGRG